jgi:hypothetical protein
MSLYSKQKGYLTNVCDVQISFTGLLFPSNVEGWQQFYNSLGVDIEFLNLYFSKASVSFTEESKDSNSGIYYTQKLILSFPERFDDKRSERIDSLHKLKFVQINFNNGKSLVLGRNDYLQNRRPVVTVKSDLKYTQVQIETDSIVPSGYNSSDVSFGLPTFFPISFT